MSRFDKYDPISGGFRAKLNAAVLAAGVGVITAVSINSSGRVVVGGASLDLIRGVICPVRAMAAGEVVDVMTAGEITEATTSGAVAFSAGDVVYAHTDGTVDATSASGLMVAQIIEADRAVVRVTFGGVQSAKAIVAATAPTLTLNDLADVDTTGVADTNQLTYVAAGAATAKWQPKSAAAGA